MNNMIMSLILMTLATALLGCQSTPSNTKAQSSTNSNDETPINWNTDFVPGRVYELLTPAVLIKYNTWARTDHMILSLSRSVQTRFRAPNSVEEYHRVGSKSRRWRHVTMLKPGVLIRYEETRLVYGGAGFGTTAVPVGRLVADEYSDVGLVEISGLSTNRNIDYRAEGYPAKNVDTECIRPVDEEAPGTRSGANAEADSPLSWATNYIPGQVYELKTRVIVLREKTPAGTEYIIKRHHDLTHPNAEPSLLEEYHRVGSKAWKWRNVVALLEPGTRIRYEETRSYHGGPITMDSLGVPVGRLVADEYRDVGPIEMSDISKCSNYNRPGAVAFDYYPRYVKQIEE